MAGKDRSRKTVEPQKDRAEQAREKAVGPAGVKMGPPLAKPNPTESPPEKGKPGRRLLWILLGAYLLAALISGLLLGIFEQSMGCWFQQIPIEAQIPVILLLFGAAGGILKPLIEALVRRFLGPPAQNSPLTAGLGLLVLPAIPLALFGFFFLVIIPGSDGSYIRPMCPTPATEPAVVSTVLSATPPSTIPVDTPTAQPAAPTLPPETATQPPSPVPTNTPDPRCVSAKLESIDFVIKGRQPVKTPGPGNHFSLISSETAGLTDLVGTVHFTDPKVKDECTCSLKGSSTGQARSYRDIGSGTNCAFNIHLSGSEKIVYVILEVAGGPNIPFVIDFP